MAEEGKSRTLEFKAFYWKCEDNEEENKLQIHVGGRTENNESVHCVIENFTPFVYLEMPGKIKWNRAKCIAVFDYFKKIMKDDGPIEYWTYQKYKLIYKEKCDVMCMTFPTDKGMKSFASRCRNTKQGLSINGVGVFRAGEFVVHESNIDSIIKFTATRQISLASWIKVKETVKEGEEELDEEERKFSTADIDMYVDWLDVEPVPPKPNVIIRPIYGSFDIECNSKNHNSKLPDADIPENCIFQIAICFGVFGKKGMDKYLFTLWNPHDKEGYTTIRCQNEKDLLLRWRALVEEKNPDVLVGYNTLKFDWNYMISRAEKLGIYTKFAQLSRLIGKRADLAKITWSSAAYGEQNFRYLDPIGKTNVDVLSEVERNYKLPKYSLDAVSEFFLKEHKEDIAPRQLFMLYQLTEEMTGLFEEMKKEMNVNDIVPRSKRIEIKQRIQSILPLRRCHGVVKDLRKKLLEAARLKDFINHVREALTLTGSYNVQDTILPVTLCEKLNLWTVMEETSNIMHIPLSYIHTRGQQIKVVAQVYREILFNDIIIPQKERKEGREKYQGAVVIEANPGDYDNVICVDFESLYPSMIIVYNICWTTLKRDSDPIPDEKCHVLEFEDHVGCPHDSQRRKKKKEDILCRKNRFRFEKVIYHPDGTSENEGVLPKLERKLLSERKVRKKEMANLEAKYKMATSNVDADTLAYYKKVGWNDVLSIKKGSLTEKELEILSVGIKVLNAQQLALKTSANSAYGTLGSQTGPIPLIEGAASVTAMGREMIINAIKYILGKYPEAKLVYGDSVVPDTPVLLRMNGRTLEYVNIEDIPIQSPWLKFGDKEQAIPMYGIEIWSDKGFTPLKKIIRHYTKKSIYRVLTHTGSVDVTEDHSILSPEGKKLRPADVEVGTKLLHSDLPEVEHEILEDLVKACPYSLGFFYGDGSCGCPSGKKHSWALNNTNKDFLNRAKKELEAFYDLKFNILDTMESSGVYKLVPKGNDIKSLVIEWRSYFYSPRRQKRVPEEILNAPLKYVELFMEGYYAADGDKDSRQTCYRFDNKGQIGAAGLLFLAQRLGYSTSINCRTDKLDIYKITCTKSHQRKDTIAIKKLWNLGETEDYVYDIETENHHFSAGVGNLVVHNTDSGMIRFEGKTTEETFELGDKVSKETSHYLRTRVLCILEDFGFTRPSTREFYRIDKYPREHLDELDDNSKILFHKYQALHINLQFENLYKRYLLLSKKRYVADAVNRKGEVVAKIKKGIVLARRDNCLYLRDSYSEIVEAVKKRCLEQEIMYILYDRIHKLFTRQIPDANLIMYTGVKSIMNYAKKKEIKQGKVAVKIIFLDEDNEPIDDPFGPLDPRLVYGNLPQVLLALKMLRRGDDIPPNTRLEYLYVQNEKAEHQGEKAEDYTFYRENKDLLNLKPDYLHYIEKQLMKPVTELIGVKFPRQKILHETLEDGIERNIGKLDELIRHRVTQIKIFSRRIQDFHNEIKVGWAVKSDRYLCSKCLKNSPIKCSKHNPKTKHRDYIYKGFAAKVEYILESIRTKKQNPKAKNEIDGSKYKELMDLCLTWKSRNILNHIYSFHNIRKRTKKRPSQTGEKLRLKVKDEFVKVMLTEQTKSKSGKKYPRGTLVTLKEIYEEKDGRSIREKKKYYYDVEVESEIIERIPRDKLATWRYKDGDFIKDILLYRGNFIKVVADIKKIFLP